jgi:hypothetical protein
MIQEIHHLSWDGDETSTVAGEEDRSMEVQEPIPPPQTEVAAEATLQEATIVEGTCTSPLVDTKHSSRNRRN